MYTDPDWDPLKTLNDLIINLEEQSHLTLTISQQVNKLAQQINNQNTAINQLAQFHNLLCQRISKLEKTDDKI